MGLLIDSSVLIEIEREAREPQELLALLDAPAVISVVTASEILHGVHRANTPDRRNRRQAFVERILALLPVLPCDLDVARTHSRLWADLRSRGENVGQNDLWIAATALVHGHAVLTHNVRDFGRVNELEVLLWSEHRSPAGTGD
ncbi:MAG: type II toxin-antitoxin system VapC family toxin [bacterium]|nr:type II toxin-antitoxin system VapC family toxin [bacterium]